MTDRAKTALAGAASGIVCWVTLRERWQDCVASLLVGSLCGLPVGPFVNLLIKPMIGNLAPNGDSNGFASFLVGLGGITIAGLLIVLILTRTSKAMENGDAQSGPFPQCPTQGRVLGRVHRCRLPPLHRLLM